MWTVFAIVFLLLSAAMFVLRHAFPIPFLAHHCYWWGASFLIVFVLFQLWFWLRPSPIPFSTNEAEAVRSAVEEALARAEKADGFRPATAAVVHFVSDPTDEATEILRRELAARDGWTLVNGSPALSFVKSIAKTVYEATSVDEYLRPGARVGLDVVFYGVLNHVSTEKGVSRASVTLTAYDTRIGLNLFKGDVTGSFPRVRTALGRAVVAKSRSSRIWIFSIVALLLPWVSSPLSLKVLAHKDNGASAAVLGALTLVDVIVGAILFYDVSDHLFRAVCVVAVCVFYNLVACEVLARRHVS